MNNQRLTDEKLIVECRIEAGCLGPAGSEYVDGFCEFATCEFRHFDTNKISWNIIPRQNSSQAEVQYTIVGKKLSQQQAAKYLSVMDIDIAEFESQIDDRLILLIEQYMV